MANEDFSGNLAQRSNFLVFQVEFFNNLFHKKKLKFNVKPCYPKYPK